jgi:hypothetical protein
MVRQESDSCLVVPRRACYSPPVSKENLYDLYSSSHPSLASSSSRPQTRRPTTPPRLSGASKSNQPMHQRRLHLHLAPQLDLIAPGRGDVGEVLEECIGIVEESTGVDRDGVSSDMALTIPKRMASPQDNLKTPCTLPDDITRVGNLVSPT